MLFLHVIAAGMHVMPSFAVLATMAQFIQVFY